MLVILLAVGLASSLTLLAWVQADAATHQDDCIGNFGSWSGTDAETGTCTFTANSNWAIANCGADHTFTEEFTDDETYIPACTLFVLAASSSGQPESGGCKTEARGPLETRVVLYLCHLKNGSATFPVGACSLKCVISADLPAQAERKMPGNAAAVIYVRLVAPGGTPGTDTYTVCFNVADLGLQPPSIYRFTGGEWVLVAFGNEASTVVCTVARGDGAFYLGEPSKPKKE
jgi:hypothetical protein